ncbi:MAG: RdgB/HAM1 family non-canonical purine NTP pyrophosphatase [Gammaproteobacteria bacterium]|nr:MAG: RdgB/HAM1 family non-canonical purine NTP pyrophosphatase [Gammaproteobacteria bacterium]
MNGAPPSAEPAARVVVLATGNAGKAREIRALLGAAWEVLLQSDLGVPAIAETGTSFAENAVLKARHAAVATGRPAIGDDSGLEVDALGGAPGIFSARYAGPQASDADNVARLLEELAGVPAVRRGARFRCVLAYLRGPDDAAPVITEGVWEGRIAAAPRGREGFGYDPVFEDPALGRTAAELDSAIKNERSHRGQALRKLAATLAGRG